MAKITIIAKCFEGVHNKWGSLVVNKHLVLVFLLGISLFGVNAQSGPLDDFDGDLIINRDDLDDDNDGILDVDEGLDALGLTQLNGAAEANFTVFTSSATIAACNPGFVQTPTASISFDYRWNNGFMVLLLRVLKRY